MRAATQGGRRGGGTHTRRGIQEDFYKAQSPPDRLCALNPCGHPGGGRIGGNPQLTARAYRAQPGAGGGNPDMAARDPSARP